MLYRFAHSLRWRARQPVLLWLCFGWGTPKTLPSAAWIAHPQRRRHLHRLHHARAATGGVGTGCRNFAEAVEFSRTKGLIIVRGRPRTWRPSGPTISMNSQALHLAGADRGQGQFPQRRRRHPAGPPLLPQPPHPLPVSLTGEQAMLSTPIELRWLVAARTPSSWVYKASCVVVRKEKRDRSRTSEMHIPPLR